ncbi:MAG: hypothetical protein ABIS06_18460 [Vicinamibacterales bacterium]
MRTIRCVVAAAVIILGAVPLALAQRTPGPGPTAILGDDPKRTLLIDLPYRPAHFRDPRINEVEMRHLRQLELSRGRARSADARSAWMSALLVVLLNAIALAYARFRTSKA